MRISYGIADVCSSDLDRQIRGELWCVQPQSGTGAVRRRQVSRPRRAVDEYVHRDAVRALRMVGACAPGHMSGIKNRGGQGHMREPVERRSEEHTSELQSLMRISYAVFCLKKKKEHTQQQN